MREANIKRTTSETDIDLWICLDGTGKSSVDTGCGFLDHMLTLFSKHSHFDLNVVCKGDYDVDYHHTVEDVGICLGKAIKSALGDMKGITRYGFMILPMDEALILTAVDISQRAQLNCRLFIPTQKVGDFDTELCREFMAALARSLEMSLHIRQLDGENSHHIIEGTFKSLAKSLKAAVSIDADARNEIPSTKGIL